MDLTDLNKAYPKDPYLFPWIGLLVDLNAGHELLSFMNAYSGYNQIKMYEMDMEATSFIIDRGICCYKVMPLRIKNVWATHQQLVNRIFKENIRDTMKVYVDDMVVKRKEKKDNLTHLQDSFDLLQKYNIKLNP